MNNPIPELIPCKCGARCSYEDINENEPCYGNVYPFDMDDGGDWSHGCVGHYGCFDNLPYEPFNLKNE